MSIWYDFISAKLSWQTLSAVEYNKNSYLQMSLYTCEFLLLQER